VSARGGSLGDGESRDPTIANSGFFVSFVTDASNLAIKSSGVTGDRNGQRDAYIWTDASDVTILESVSNSGDPLGAGAASASTSYYRNYVVFESAGDNAGGRTHIYLRYLGGI
jgi:hypothetical protein